MSAAHRIGFTFYLGEMQKNTIFNSYSLEDRNVIIQMYIDKASNTSITTHDIVIGAAVHS